MESKQGFGRYIREKRTALGLSQRALAERLFVTESAVSKWERGVSYPDITQITPLCEALQVSEHELVTASDDWRQRRLEQDAATHRKVRMVWLVGIGALYALIVVGMAWSAAAGASRPSDVVVAAAACAMCASVTHVPVLVPAERGMAALLSFYASLNVCVAAGFMGSGSPSWAADFGVAFVALLFILALLAGPALAQWAARRVGAFVGEPVEGVGERRASTVANMLQHHRALSCLAVDTVLLLCLVAVVSVHGAAAAVTVARMVALAGVLVVPVWAAFLVLRYLSASLPFCLALVFALFGVWVFFVGGIAGVILGGPFDWHAAVNFADWTTYPAVNDNLCWIVLLVCLVVAAVLCVVGVAREKATAAR